MNVRIGFGVDVHQLSSSHDLIIGGVKIESDLGAVGHSDADVLIHAICDALLGAANLRDIGFHFSDTDPKYRGIDSTILLKEVVRLIHDKGFQIGNIDSTVILEKPKLNPHIPAMQEVLAEVMGISNDDIAIKATTHEKVDSFGKRDALKAYAVCILHR